MTDPILRHSAEYSKSIPATRFPIQPGLGVDLATAGSPSPLAYVTRSSAEPEGSVLAPGGAVQINTSSAAIFAAEKADRRAFDVLNILRDQSVRFLSVSRGARISRVKFRTPDCLCFHAPGSNGAGFSVKNDRVFLTGLAVCCRVWTCPVCGDRITRRRAEDIRLLINAHLGKGGNLYMLTLTAPHGVGEDLRKRMDAFGVAYRRFTKSRRVKDLGERLGLLGAICSKEVTHSFKAGFHDHYHVLWFARETVGVDYLSAVLFHQWRLQLSRAGLGEAHRKGFDFREMGRSGDYIAKLGWNPAKEIARSGEKRGRGESRHPFDLVLDWGAGNCSRGLSLFLQYAGATHGRQYISTYLPLARKLGVNLSAKTDDEIVAEAAEDALLLFVLGWELWKRVLQYGKRQEALRICQQVWLEKQCPEACADAVASFCLGGCRP